MIKKLLFLVVFLFFWIIAGAQEHRNNEYYIVPEDGVNIDFEQIGDRIILNSSVTSINSFFNNNVTVVKIERA